MNEALRRLGAELDLQGDERRMLRLAFGFACADRVAHLLEDPALARCLATLDAFLNDGTTEEFLVRDAREAARLASGHRGSPSLDGSGHAAVSASHAVANALAGQALVAASYAAYATVYAYGAYAVRDPQSFDTEFTWQVATLRQLANRPVASRTDSIDAR